MNITNREESILKQLKNIVESMRASGRKPLRIYLTWGQLQALNSELQSVYRVDRITAGRMELYGIPLELTPPGSGLWVSCVSESH